MRRILLLAPVLSLAMLSLAACVAPQSAPQPEPPPPAVAVTEGPPPRIVGWQDGPVMPGSWAWTRSATGSVATFGVAGQEPAFVATCDLAHRTIALSIPAAATPTLTIDTSDGARTLPATTIPATPPRTGATLPAADGFLDRIAFSRGRFRVRSNGTAPMVIPAWPEFARTVEDCRP